MHKVKWISIEIGHVATVKQTDYVHGCASLTDEQRAVMSAIRCAARAAWAAGGELEVMDDPAKTDSWVAGVLQQAINDLRMPGYPEVLIDDKKHLIGTLSENGRSLAHTVVGIATSSDPGTHCRLRGDRWVNERTYWLFDGNGMAWLYGSSLPYRLNYPHIATATLVWECRKLDPCILSGSALPAAEAMPPPMTP